MNIIEVLLSMAQNKKIIELERRITELELEKKQLLKLVSHDVKIGRASCRERV